MFQEVKRVASPTNRDVIDAIDRLDRNNAEYKQHLARVIGRLFANVQGEIQLLTNNQQASRGENSLDISDGIERMLDEGTVMPLMQINYD